MAISRNPDVRKPIHPSFTIRNSFLLMSFAHRVILTEAPLRCFLMDLKGFSDLPREFFVLHSIIVPLSFLWLPHISLIVHSSKLASKNS